jgi:CelD/BcsL family acetyltransferase involved in cellulose biosynthesis
LTASVIEDVSQLDDLLGPWDGLAVGTGSPFGAPAWALGWWRHAAPDGATLAVVAVQDGDELVGLAPFYSLSRLGITELRLLSGGWASRLGVLAQPGREGEVAAAIAESLAEPPLRADVIRWEAVDAASPWPSLLAEGRPEGRSDRIKDLSQRSAPLLYLRHDSFEEWFAERSSHFRRNMRRDRRQIEKKGARFRLGNRASLERDLDSFARLHSARQEHRGGSTAVNPGAMAALREIGAALIDEGRLRLWMIDGPDGEAISAHVFVSAGETTAFWNTGFDMEWSKHSPGAIGLIAAIEDSFERGEKVMDLGGGEAGYKDRVADEDHPVAWRTAYRRGPRYPLALMRGLPEQVARRGSVMLRERLGTERVDRLRRLLRR